MKKVLKLQKLATKTASAENQAAFSSTSCQSNSCKVQQN